MISFTEKFLHSVINLQSIAEWRRFLDEFKSIVDTFSEDVMNSMPDPSDFNAHDRFNTMRGMVVALNMIHHAMSDPAGLLEDIKIIEESVASVKDNNPF